MSEPARDRDVPRADAVSEADLARDLVEARPEAALIAWQRYHRLVAVTLRRMLGPGDHVEDLTQEVFLRFFDKVKELKKLDSLRAFVTAIAIRRAQEEIKRRRVRRRFAPFINTFMPATITEMDVQSRDAIARFYGVLDRLSVTDRAIYILRHIEGMDQATISDTLGVSLSTVRRRIDRVSARVESLVRQDPVLADYLTSMRKKDGRPSRPTLEAAVTAVAGAAEPGPPALEVGEPDGARAAEEASLEEPEE